MDCEENSETGSLHNDSGSADAVEDITGKSLGRISVHSVSRLIEDSKLQQRMSEEQAADDAADYVDTVKVCVRFFVFYLMCWAHTSVVNHWVMKFFVL